VLDSFNLWTPKLHPAGKPPDIEITCVIAQFFFCIYIIVVIDFFIIFYHLFTKIILKNIIYFVMIYLINEKVEI
jgi:hypothetical protein